MKVMQKIGIGIIGTGMMGKTHAYGIRNLPFYYSDLPFDARLVGVCSGHSERAEQFRDLLGFDFATDDFKALVAHPAIDAVCVCAPNHLHYPMVMAAIRAGKHVYCEKPLAANEQEANAIVETLSGQKLVHQIVFNNRFLPATMRARQLIQDGRIGRVLNFRASYLHAGSVDPKRPIGWKQDSQFAGGVLLDLGTHVLDLMRSLLGDYCRVMAKSQIILPQRPNRAGEMVDIEAEDSFLMLAEMMDGSLGTLEATKVATGSNDELRFEIHGELGAIRFNLMEPEWLDFFDNTDPEADLGGNRGFKRIECVGRYAWPASAFPSAKATIGWLRGHVHSLYSFLDCVSTGRQATPSLLDGAYIQHVCNCARQSDELGSWIDC